MRHSAIVPLALFVAAACGDADPQEASQRTPVLRDLAAIIADTLRVGVIEDAFTWEERTYGDAGLEWDLLTAFAEACHLPMIPVPMDSLEQLHRALVAGEVDVIAAQLGEGTLHAGTANTTAYARAHPVILFRRPSRKGGKVAVDTVHVARSTAIIDGALQPVERFDDVVFLPSPSTTSQLLDRVVVGVHDAVIMQQYAAARALEQFPYLGGATWSEKRSPLVFAVRSNAPQLLAAINGHLADETVQRTLAGELEDLRFKERLGPFGSSTPAVRGDTISGFDKHFRRVADSLALDWHLLAAIAFRESRFDSAAGSNMGAQGLMQLMPATAARFSGKSKPGVEGHVIGAAVYLRELDTLWQRSVPDRQQRQRFVLASYNAGEAHIQDAQRLAAHFGLRTDRWENNVERTLLLLACPRHWRKPPVRNGFCKGAETFRFVRNVIGTWAYFGTVPEEEVRPDSLRGQQRADTTALPAGTHERPDTPSVGAATGG